MSEIRQRCLPDDAWRLWDDAFWSAEHNGLNLSCVPDDGGIQTYILALPAPSGRELFRTQNMAEMLVHIQEHIAFNDGLHRDIQNADRNLLIHALFELAEFAHSSSPGGRIRPTEAERYATGGPWFGKAEDWVIWAIREAEMGEADGGE